MFLTEIPGDQPQKAAIKLIPADAGDPKARVDGWAQAATLSHPHLMRLFHSGDCQIDDSRMSYSVTEYAEEVLSEILPERPLTRSEVNEMLDPVLDALSYLHGKGFVHSRLKPSNILVVGDQLKLSSDCLQVTGEVGKALPPLSVYDAPEVASGAIMPATDLWSLGVTLVEALTQRLPVWERSTQREPVLPAFIPQPYAEIARQCLRTDPAQRCMLGDLKARLQTGQALPRLSGKSGRALRVAAVVGAVLVLFGGIAAWQLRPGTNSGQSSNQTQSTPNAEDPQTANQQAATPQVMTHQPENQKPAPAVAAPTPLSPLPKTHTAEETHGKNGARVKGEVAERVLPDVLPRASQTITGKIGIKVQVTVDASGNVSDASLDSQGSSKYFSKAALQAAQQWKFKPARVDGQAVSSVWTLQFEFTRTGTEVTPVETAP
ncbi:MAG: TonB family protein [Terracidiphilus sp.]